MHSALYRGSLSHRRILPREHRFRYRLFLAYLDLSELDTVFGGRWFWSTRRAALARFDRRDHLGDPAVPLERAVRDLVEARLSRRPSGPIRLLTHLRYFGCCFNPVSFYYCFAADGERLEAIVAEVNNTPWGERHCYVLDGAPQPGSAAAPVNARVLRFRFDKDFHVSPFMPLEIEYDWRFTLPGERLAVHTALAEPGASGRKVFDATLALERVPIGAASLAATLALFPLMTMKVVAAIYWEALRLWVKRTPFHPHPASRGSPPRAAAASPRTPPAGGAAVRASNPSGAHPS